MFFFVSVQDYFELNFLKRGEGHSNLWHFVSLHSTATDVLLFCLYLTSHIQPGCQTLINYVFAPYNEKLFICGFFLSLRGC